MSTDRSDQDDSHVPPPDTPVLVVGDPFAAAVARRLGENTIPVRLLTDDPRAKRMAEPEVSVTDGDPADATTLRETLDPDETLVVATNDDGRSLLIAGHAAAGDSERVVTVVGDPERVDVFQDARVTPVCASRAVARTVVEELMGSQDDA